MGQQIPVFFMPVEAARCVGVEAFHTFEDALQLLPNYEEREGYGVRTSASRNSWHELALYHIAEGLAIEGLEFVVADHFICVRGAALRSVIRSLETLLHGIQDGIPDLGVYECYDVALLR